MAPLLTGLSKHTFKKEWNIEDDLYIDITLEWENGTIPLSFNWDLVLQPNAMTEYYFSFPKVKGRENVLIFKLPREKGTL